MPRRRLTAGKILSTRTSKLRRRRDKESPLFITTRTHSEAKTYGFLNQNTTRGNKSTITSQRKSNPAMDLVGKLDTITANTVERASGSGLAC
jgi:hypothetical protein